eukprot:7107845-Alexandrium_andersonii.AAC.1
MGACLRGFAWPEPHASPRRPRPAKPKWVFAYGGLRGPNPTLRPAGLGQRSQNWVSAYGVCITGTRCLIELRGAL